ncbi:MAG: response regulator [Treponema sp.]|nr:response regulator [Treponema sp.]
MPAAKERFSSMTESGYDTSSAGANPARPQFPNARVLVVDDVTANLAAVRAVLKPCGMRIDCINSGQKALELIRRDDVQYDAIFMDHLMPEMDGIQTVRLIRCETANDYVKTVPIIALTASSDGGAEELFLKNGFQDFLSKPVDVNCLDAVLRKWLGGK